MLRRPMHTMCNREMTGYDVALTHTEGVPTSSSSDAQGVSKKFHNKCHNLLSFFFKLSSSSFISFSSLSLGSSYASEILYVWPATCELLRCFSISTTQKHAVDTGSLQVFQHRSFQRWNDAVETGSLKVDAVETGSLKVFLSGLKREPWLLAA